MLTTKRQNSSFAKNAYNEIKMRGFSQTNAAFEAVRFLDTTSEVAEQKQIFLLACVAPALQEGGGGGASRLNDLKSA